MNGQTRKPEASGWMWTIGLPDRASEDIFDNFKTPSTPGDTVWNVTDALNGVKQSWPMFHPSEADPEAGYRSYTYSVVFPLDEVKAGSYTLRLDLLEIAPRLAHLSVRVNGKEGKIYVFPKPSQSDEIRLQSGLHTTIYSEESVEIPVPSSLLRTGENRLELTAVDGQEFIRVDRIEAVKRLDRMANGAGLLYQFLAFGYKGETGSAAFSLSTKVVPTVMYRRSGRGELLEQCHWHLRAGGEAASGSLTLSDEGGGAWEPLSVALDGVAFGDLLVPFEVKDWEGPVHFRVEGGLDGEAVSLAGTFERRRKWKVYITPHAHTDIGYTHRQFEVAERLCRNIDAALDILEREAVNPPGDGAPPPYSYHLDSSWVLETYWATRDEKRKRQLLKWVQARRIGIAGHYVDLLTQFAGVEDLIRNGEFTESVLRPHGLQSKFTSVVDVASITGSMPAILEGSGIRYLVHADNQDRGPFRLNGGLHRVSPFYWEGTAGGRVLTWLAKMYCELRKVCGSPPVPNSAERGLDMWLQEYESAEYVPDAVLLYGQEADNTDMDPQPVEFVKEWNGKYEYPKLIACDVSEYFEYVEERFGPSLRTVRGDGGAYWEDGAGSSIAETMAARQAQAMLPAAERLEALAVAHTPDWRFPDRHYEDAWRELLLYDEHTWGAFLSATEPDALLAADQWEVKSHMAAGAKQWAKRLLHTAAARHSLNWNNDGREVVVYNPHSWTFSGPATAEISPGEKLYEADTGREVPLRILTDLPTQRVVEFWAEALPGLSYRRYVLQPAGPGEMLQAPVPLSLDDNGMVVLENRYYRLTIDAERGCAVSWFDKERSLELIDVRDEWGFGQFLHADGGEGTRLISNQADLPPGNPQVDGSFRLGACSLTKTATGTILKMQGAVAYGMLEAEWLLPDASKQVDVQFRYHKKDRREKEAVYVAFPAALVGASVSTDSQLGWVDWHRDQLPGGCKEWLPLQSGILAETAETAVLIASPDIPLFCVGDIVRGTWPKEKDLSGGRIFSYVLNNYWHTNYKASQGGTIAFRYRLTSGAAIPKADAYRFGWQARQPFYAQRMSFQDFRETKPVYSDAAGGTLAVVEAGSVVLSTLKAAKWGEGLIVRFQEISGTAGHVRFRIPERKIRRVWQTDLLEREIREFAANGDGSLEAEVPAWGLATFRIELE